MKKGCILESSFIFSLPARVANHSAGFSSSRLLEEPAIHTIIKNVAASLGKLTETIMYSQSDLLLSLTITVPRLLTEHKSIGQLKVEDS